MGTKNRNRRIADFFCFTITLFVFCFPHTTLSWPSLSSKKHDNTNNKDNISILFPKVIVQGCPSLSSKNTRQQRQHFYLIPKSYCPRLSLVVVKKYDNTNNKDNISILFPKVIVQGCPSLSSKKHDNIDNKDNISFLFQKCCPRLSFVVVKKIIFSWKYLSLSPKILKCSVSVT